MSVARLSTAQRGLFLVALLFTGIPVTAERAAEPTASARAEEIKSILRPAVALRSESLVRGTDVVTYTAVLAAPAQRAFKDRYLEDLANRGVWIHESSGSAYRPRPGQIGYTVRVLQELRPSPFTIRYKVAYLGEEMSAVGAQFPLDVHGRKLTFRLGTGVLRPWRTQVVVPDRDVAQLPFPIPLPPSSIIIGVYDERRTKKDSSHPSVRIRVLQVGSGVGGAAVAG